MWPLAAGVVVGAGAQYVGYRKCIYDVDKASGLVPGFPLKDSALHTQTSDSN